MPDHTLVYAYDLPRNSGGVHWRIRQAQRDRARRLFGSLPDTRRVRKRAVVRWTRVLGPRQRDMDESNFCMLTKGIEDALTIGGYIVDDSPKWIDRLPHTEDGTRREFGPRIEISIHYEEA
jgi:hypothetical protein